VLIPEFKENLPQMRKIMIAALSLSLLSGTAVLFAQNTSTDTGTKSTKKAKKKKAKKTTATDTMSSPK
jgi:uncharacterized protein YxeA